MDEREQFGIENEPGYTGEASKPVKPEHICEPKEEDVIEPQDRLQRIEHSVYDEPALADVDKSITKELSYKHWLAENWGQTSYIKSWLVTMGIVLVTGPLSVAAVFIGIIFMFGFLATLITNIYTIIFSPVIEEVFKIALIYYFVEKRPYLFHSMFQILIAALAGGLMFAVIENLLYLNVYIPDPTVEIIRWRWIVCTLLHMSCSAIASIGLVRMWLDTFQRQGRPRLELAYPFITAAMVIHGCYNGLAILLEWTTTS